MLILCAATFAVGILAGSLFFGQEESFHAPAAPEADTDCICVTAASFP